MHKEQCEIMVNGIEYVRKNSVMMAENYVIVRTHSAGVHAGELVTKEKSEVELKNARRLWYWSGAASLSQLAMEGVSKPQNCKFPCEVTKIILLGVIEVISCTQKAVDSIKGVPIWAK